MQTATDDHLVGRLLEGRYRVRRLLARGGMSTVYSALDERLDRDVAVKVMSSALSSDPAFARRFADEARVAARLSHTNAVAVYDQGIDGSHVFLVMELVNGRTLRDLLREYGALSPTLAVSIMQPLLSALAAAHRAGLVHRDVKPENILLADDGAVKVADFGLSRAIESDLSSTRTGLMMGTVAYCPPEQLSRGTFDARSDVYSAGIVLFELLTGAPPYRGENAMAVAFQHVHSDVPAPSSVRPGIAWQLDDIVQRATRREPSGRPLDAGAFLAELHTARIDAGLPVVPVPPRRDSRAPVDSTQRIPRISDPRATGHRSADPRAQDEYPTSTSDPRGYPSTSDPRGRPMSAGGSATAPNPGVPPPGEIQHTLVNVPRVGGVSRPVPGADNGHNGGRRGIDDAPPQQSRRQQQPTPRRTRKQRRRLAWIVALIVLLLGAGAGAGTWWLLAGRFDRVPNVDGLSQQLAVNSLRSQGFKATTAATAQFSETVPAGAVISTSPGESARVVHGRSVQLVLSKGQERFTIPAVTAKQTYNDVVKLLAGMPVTPLASQKSDDTIPVGMVIATAPPVGTLVKRGQVITVYVSSGPPVLKVPDVGGSAQATADATVSKAGFAPSDTQAFSNTVAAGVVISQNPVAGAAAVKFSTVTIVVSKGPQLVTIPDIPQGSDADVAQTLLNNLGLDASIKKQHSSIFDFSSYSHQVVSVTPPSGTTVPIGSDVVIHAE